MTKFGVLAPQILNPGTLMQVLYALVFCPKQTATGNGCSATGVLALGPDHQQPTTATGTQVRPNGSLELLQKRRIFHREILFMMDLNLYLCLLFMCIK
jgi:hypothetical protein